MSFFKQVESEIDDYLNKKVEIADGIFYSEYRLKRRISFFENKEYPEGKVDSKKRYKYYFDIIAPRVSDNIKNLRVDSGNWKLETKFPKKFFLPTIIANAAMQDFLNEKGYRGQFQEDVEVFSGWGNVLWKKVGKKWERLDLKDVYLTNTRAKTVEDTDIIERKQLNQSELRKKTDWDNVEWVIENLKDKTFSVDERASKEQHSSPVYEIYERNGEISVADFKKLQGKTPSKGDKSKYILAKVIMAGLRKGQKEENKKVLFIEEIKSIKEVYEESHRGPYKGKWMREGLYELLFDHQIRANQIGNQIANGLLWASKTFFKSQDVRTFQNVITQIQDGQIINSADLAQVITRMDGFDQLIADYNRIIQEVDRIANSLEVVRGEVKSGTPFRLGALLDDNANKLFIFLRQKITLPYKRMFEEAVLPELIKDLKGKDIIRLTGDDEFLLKFREFQVQQWFNRNLMAIGPSAGDPEIRQAIFDAKLEEFMQEDPAFENSDKKMWEGVLSSLRLNISGENDDLNTKLESVVNVLQFEADPNIRGALLDMLYKGLGLDVPERQPIEPPQQQEQRQEPRQEQRQESRQEPRQEQRQELISQGI